MEVPLIVLVHDRTRHAQTEDQINIPSKKDPKRPALSEEQKQDLLESLKFDQIDDRKNTIKRAHIKTCKWLLKSTDYLDWLDISKMNEHHGFLWIKGKAGAGKSTLMKFALERAPKGVTMNLVLSFFFNARGSTLEKSTLGAYRSLLLQLLIGFPALWHIFDSLYSATSNFNASREWSVESLKILLEEAIQSLEKVSIMCFIDALDECDEDEIRDMVQFFEHIGDLSIERGVRLLICFSSRHYPHITIRKGLELVLEGHEGHSQDLASYIETELKIGKSKKAQQIRAAIQEKAAGIFMWVVLVVDILNKESDRGRVDRLQQKLHEIPGGLHELFRDILTRDSNNKEQLVLCIQWVLFAKQPLSPEQLYYAILSGIDPDAVTAWDPDEVEPDSIRRFILDSSKGFTDVTVSKKNKKVQFIHESVRDFLLKENGLSKVWPEYKDNFPGQSHERLTQCSWNYLNIGIKTSLDVPNVLPKANSQEAIDLRLSAERHFPFLEYAVQNLFYHANLTEGHGISQANILKNIRLERWVQLNNIVEKHGIRRHHKHVSLLYVLAELDCDMLIKPHLPHEQVLKIENERYGCPLFAACALGNKGTLRVLLDAFAQQLPSEDSDHEHAEADTTASTVSKIYRDFTYAKKKSLVVNASLICPEWLIIRLLESPTDCLDIPSSDIRDMLLTASRRGYPNLVEILLRDHADVFGNATKDEALHTAVKNGNESTVRLLVSHGANIEAQEDGENAIHIASRKGFESIAIFLLDNRPDLLDNKSMKGETALYLATDKEHGVLATKLIQRGAEIHLKPSFGGSILYCASKSGLKDVVMLLLDKGAKIKSQHGELFNVLIGAIKGGNKEIVELLLEHGADVDTQGGRYSSALQEASVRGHKDIVELLLKKGNDVNIEGGQHGSALQAASFMGHKDIVELLLKNGSDTKAVVGYYGNALQVASVRGHKDIVELLLAKGADVNAEGGQYGSALQAASIKGRKDIVKLLLKNGADTKAVVGYYGSALQAASVRGHKDIVELLLTKGADVNAEGGKYGSALNAALIEGRKEIRALLIARGAK
jgi:ankyrin repeat protein